MIMMTNMGFISPLHCTTMFQRSQFEARGSEFSEGTGEYTVAVSRAS